MASEKRTEIEVKDVTVRAGDEVKILDTRPNRDRYLRGTYKFVALVTTDKGTQYVDVSGGKAGRSLSRSFAPERVEPIKRRKPKHTEQ